MADTDKHWEEWGRRNPYFAVLTSEQFQNDKIESSRDEFFETGETLIDRVIRKLDSLQTSPSQRHRALDFGCGVARLTIPLAKRFVEVLGIDIADSMLVEAGKNAARYGCSNIKFAKSDDTVSRAEGLFDLITSFIVLQHIPIKRGYRIIDQLLSRLAPGGSVMLHVSLRRSSSLAKRAVYFAKNNIPYAHYGTNLLQGMPLSTPLMQMNEYDLLTVLEAFERHGVGNLAIELDNHQTVATALIFGVRAPT